MHPHRYIATGQTFTDAFTGLKLGFTDSVWIYGLLGSFLYGYGIHSLPLCVSSNALGVTSISIASYSVISSLYSGLPIVLMIVHSDGTSFLSIHNIPLTDELTLASKHQSL